MHCSTLRSLCDCFTTSANLPAGAQHNHSVLVIKHERSAVRSVKLDVSKQLQWKESYHMHDHQAQLRYRDMTLPALQVSIEELRHSNTSTGLT